MKKKCSAVCVAMCGAMAICILLLNVIEAGLLQRGLADKVLRFHVLANSDDEEDQALKLAVRDSVGALMEEKLQGADSLEESCEIVEKNLDAIEEAAAATIAQEGYDYPVYAVLADCVFPEKTYGDYTFPAGTYEALEVVIGSGEGHNWWCVMYPNLCFSGSMYEVNEASGEELARVLDAGEYEAVLKGSEYQVKFKILGFLNRVLE